MIDQDINIKDEPSDVRFDADGLRGFFRLVPDEFSRTMAFFFSRGGE